MRRHLLLVTILVGTIALSALAPASISGQGTFSPPRMADGRPDLQGTYDLATLTPLERPNGMNAVLSREEVAKLEGAAAAFVALGARPSSGDRAAPPKG